MIFDMLLIGLASALFLILIHNHFFGGPDAPA